MKHTIVMVDDHRMFRSGVAEILNKFENYSVIWEASNGRDFVDKISHSEIPEIVILDISMPEMDGFDTARFIINKYPKIKILVLSMLDSDDSIIKMMKIGVQGYLHKDAEPLEFKTALDEFIEKGKYYSQLVSDAMANALKCGCLQPKTLQLSDREVQFLELVGTDLKYREIAKIMAVSIRTVEGYRDSLFEKLKLKSRVCLALYASKNGYLKEHKK